MKKFVIGLLSIFMMVGTINAQVGKKALKKGKKLIAKYVANPADNATKLTEGLDFIKAAFDDAELAADPSAYVKKANLFNDVAEAEIKAKLLNPEYVIANPEMTKMGFMALEKAMSLNPDKGAKKGILKSMMGLENQLNNMGIVFFDQQNYAKAFDYYNLAVKAYDMLKGMGGKSRLDDEAVRNEHLFITGASGYYGDKGADAKDALMRLYEAGSDKPLVYEALFNIEKKAGVANAIDYLSKGRELFPDDTGLLFAEINHYLQEGKLEVLIEKLEAAKEKEPDNVSIYNTLGSVYDQLNQKEREAGNVEKADSYFAKSFDYYKQALAKDPTNFDAAYSQGALYYNKAAGLTSRINSLSEDYSSEGLKKYEALKAEMEGLFDTALPFFLAAEKINDKEPNVLIALKEIFAKKGDFEKSQSYKERLEALPTAE